MVHFFEEILSILIVSHLGIKMQHLPVASVDPPCTVGRFGHVESSWWIATCCSCLQKQWRQGTIAIVAMMHFTVTTANCSWFMCAMHIVCIYPE